MYVDYIVPGRGFHPGYLLPMANDSRLSASSVLTVDGELEGMVMWEMDVQGHVGNVHARVVTEKYQGGWANALLMAGAAESGIARGATRVRYEVPHGNSDTTKLMGRTHANITGNDTTFIFPVVR